MISERLAHARRLELTDAVEVDGQVEGAYRQVKVTLEERALRFDLGAPPGWKSIALRVHDVNHPDVIITHDLVFDEQVSVLAEKGRGQQVTTLFANEDLRAAILALFQRYPAAIFEGATLTLPDLENTEKPKALEEAAALMLQLRAAVDANPRMVIDSDPVLLDGVYAFVPPKEGEAAFALDAPRPWYLDSQRSTLASMLASVPLGVIGSGVLVKAFSDTPTLSAYILTFMGCAFGAQMAGHAIFSALEKWKNK